MEKISTIDTTKYIGKEITVCGWVHSRGDHGKIISIDLRDGSGIIQIIFTPKNKEVYEKASSLRPEWVIKVKGKINKRIGKTINPNLKTEK